MDNLVVVHRVHSEHVSTSAKSTSKSKSKSKSKIARFEASSLLQPGTWALPAAEPVQVGGSQAQVEPQHF